MAQLRFPRILGSWQEARVHAQSGPKEIRRFRAAGALNASERRRGCQNLSRFVKERIRENKKEKSLREENTLCRVSNYEWGNLFGK